MSELLLCELCDAEMKPRWPSEKDHPKPTDEDYIPLCSEECDIIYWDLWAATTEAKIDGTLS